MVMGGSVGCGERWRLIFIRIVRGQQLLAVLKGDEVFILVR